MKTYILAILASMLFALAAMAQDEKPISINSFAGNWVYTAGTVTLRFQDGTQKNEDMEGKKFSFKKVNNKMVTYPTGNKNGQNLVYKIYKQSLTLDGSQSHCNVQENSQCCSHYVESSYTLEGEELITNQVFGLSCDGEVLAVGYVKGTLVKK